MKRLNIDDLQRTFRTGLRSKFNQDHSSNIKMRPDETTGTGPGPQNPFGSSASLIRFVGT